MKILKMTFSSILSSLRRMLALACAMFSSLMVIASGNWTAKYLVNVSTQYSTGSGTVYISATPYSNEDADKQVVNIIESNKKSKVEDDSGEMLPQTTSELELSCEVKADNPKNTAILFHGIKVWSKASPGSKFKGFYWGDDKTLRNGTLEIVDHTIQTQDNGGYATNQSYTNTNTYFPIFEPRTYLAKSPFVDMITLDVNGSKIDVKGGKIGLIFNEDSGYADQSDAILGGAVIEQTADEYGKYNQATIKYYFYAQANPGYYFLGWSTTDAGNIADGKTISPYLETLISKYDKEESTGEIPEVTGYYAVFAASTVKSTEDISLSTKDVGGRDTEEVIFDVTNAKNVTDYSWEIIKDDGFDISDPVLENNRVIFTVTYTDQDKHGDNIASASIKLMSKADANSNATARITASSDLRPEFDVLGNYDLTPNFPTYVGQFTQLIESDIQPTNMNISASSRVVAEPENSSCIWNMELVEGSSYYGFFDVGGKKVLRFTPTAEGTDIKATLRVTCTYRDANGTAISTYKDITLSADAQIYADLGSLLQINGTSNATIDFGTIEYGNAMVTKYVPYVAIDVTNVISNWSVENPKISYTNNGSAIIVTLAQGLELGDYENTLTYTAEPIYSGENLTATLSVIAKVRLATPVLTAYEGMSQVTLTWKPVQGASSYIINYSISTAGGTTNTGTHLINDPTATSYVHKGLTDGSSCSYTITAVYEENVAYNETSEEVLVTVGLPSELTEENVAYLNLYTGTENDGTYPYKQKWQVNLSSVFDANGNALFDRLYIFGLTTGPGGSTEIRGYADADVVMPNAITPCYIYEKSNSTTYTAASSHIPNMNVDEKPAMFNIDLSGEKYMKIYMTGYCPYGTTGHSINDHGLLYVKGDNTSQIDIYLEDCYLYARLHKADNGKSSSVSNLEANLLGGEGTGNAISAAVTILGGGPKIGALGAASAIVIESTSNEAFPANIHIKGDNLVYAHLGSPLNAVIKALGYELDQYMGQYSSPIFIRPTSESSTVTLTMDDIWPINPEKNLNIHTNGYMKFEKYWSACPSIDLGNTRTTLNFNGGRYELAANLPIQEHYKNNLTICMRDGSFMLSGMSGNIHYGMGGDGTGGTVNINDGSVYVSRFAAIIETWGGKEVDNSDFFEDLIDIGGVDYSQTLRAPQRTYVYGGSHKGYIRACSSLDNSGTSPTDGYSALEQRVYDVNHTVVENGFVKESFFTSVDPRGLYLTEYVTPSLVGSDELLLQQYYETRSNFYSMVGGSYGREAIAPDDGKIYLWVPGKMKHPVTFANWYLAIPNIVGAPELSGDGAGVMGGLGQFMDMARVALGGAGEVPYEIYGIEEGKPIEKSVLKNLLRIQCDEYLTTAAKTYGTVPVLLEGDYIYANLEKESFGGSQQDGMGDDLYADILNEEDYVLRNSIYDIRTIKADEWMLLTPAFDVSAVYVIEVGDENALKTKAQENRTNALVDQAMLNLDMLTLMGMDINSSTNDRSFWEYYVNYQNYVDNLKYYTGSDVEKNRRKPYYVNNSYNPALSSTRTPLVHLMKTASAEGPAYNYSDAHYYLYQTDVSSWEWAKDKDEEDEEYDYLKMNWELAPAPTQVEVGDEKIDVVMKKGQVYAMQFPYCPGCNDGKKWDYWTGKLLILEGKGPQTIAGTKVHSELMQNEDMGLYGNRTFAALDVEDYSEDAAYYLMYVNEKNQFIPGGSILTAGDAFLIPPALPTYLQGKRIKSINAETGAITWEEGGDNQNTTTGTPTISGNRQMMVYTIEGGVGIIPVTAQQVSIYNAAGQLITSQYLTEEVQISLPAGIYLISGEKEQAKVIVK